MQRGCALQRRAMARKRTSRHALARDALLHFAVLRYASVYGHAAWRALLLVATNVAAVTLAAMGLIYVVLPGLGHPIKLVRVARWQPWIYASGQLDPIIRKWPHT